MISHRNGRLGHPCIFGGIQNQIRQVVGRIRAIPCGSADGDILVSAVLNMGNDIGNKPFILGHFNPEAFQKFHGLISGKFFRPDIFLIKGVDILIKPSR